MSKFIIKEAKTGAFFKNFIGPDEVILTPNRTQAVPICDMQAARNVRSSLLEPHYPGAAWVILDRDA